jgi:hypothetical protein
MLGLPHGISYHRHFRLGYRIKSGSLPEFLKRLLCFHKVLHSVPLRSATGCTVFIDIE